MEELALCPGLGEKKVQRLYHALHTPFRRAPTPAGAVGGRLDSRRGGVAGSTRAGVAANASAVNSDDDAEKVDSDDEV